MLDSSYVPPASAAAELRDFRRLASSASDDRVALEHDLVLRHMKFAEGIARRYASPLGDQADIRQVALMGLVKAVKRFDAERGFPFAAFARATIVGEIKRHFRDHGWAVRPPRAVQELALAVSAVTPALEQELGHRASREELADHLAVDADRIAEALAGGRAMFASSLDELVIGSRAGVDNSMASIERHADLRHAVQSLSQRDQAIVYLRFCKGCTQAEIADELGTSQVQVSRALTKLLSRLRESLGDPGES